MGSPEAPGIIVQAAREVFDSIDTCTAREYLVRVSYLEIYNEQVHDMLSNTKTKNLMVNDDPK